MTGERMKILIVSDTHGRHRNLEEVLDREGPIDMLVHLGDVEGEKTTSVHWQTVRHILLREIMISFQI